jgi:hypothetical protein
MRGWVAVPSAMRILIPALKVWSKQSVCAAQGTRAVISFVVPDDTATPLRASAGSRCPRLREAATSSIVIGNAAYDVAVSIHPQERVLLRQGIRVIREHIPKTGGLE